MPTISELVVKITGDTSDLTKKTIEAGKNISAFGDKAIDVGKKMSVGITAPALAAGTAMIKLASDTGESLNAASVVFGKSTDTIKAWGKNAATQAGLTSAEFFQASAVIGAGLTNAGASAEEASIQTIELTKRAADMASIFNTSVDDALGALQAGLRGESEPLRRFAVSLNEADVSARAVSMGLVDGAGKATAYGKSQARLAIIMEQSSKFQGDFVNTSDQLANKTRIATAQIKEQAAQLGTKLLPYVLDAVTAISDMAAKFDELSDGQKDTILKTVALAAAIGPMLVVAGTATKAISNFSAAFKLLSAAGGGPVALAIAAIAAIGAAAGIFVGNLKDAQDEFKKLQKVMGGGTTGSLAADLKLVNDEIESIKSQIGSTEGLLPDETKQLEEELAKVQAVKLALVEKVRAQGQSEQAAASIVKKLEAEVKLDKDIEALAKKKADLEKRYTDARAEVVGILEDEKTEYQKIQEQIEELEKTPWAKGKLEDDRLKAIEILRARQKAITDDEILRAGLKRDAEIAAIDAVGDKRATEYGKAIIEAESLATKAAESIDPVSDAWTSALNKIADQWRGIDGIVSDVSTAMVDITGQALADIGEALVTGEDAWAGMGKMALESLADVLYAIGLQLAGLAAVHAIALDFAGAATAAAGSVAALLGSGVVDGMAAKYFARGTDYAPGGVAIVNEEGPEMISLPRGSSVTPATRTPIGSSGGGNTFIIQSPVAVTPSVAAQEYTRMIRNLAFEGVL